MGILKPRCVFEAVAEHSVELDVRHPIDGYPRHERNPSQEANCTKKNRPQRRVN